MTQTQDEALLGLASNEDLFRELICRFKLAGAMSNVSSLMNVERAVALAEMLGGMDAGEREYRTVDHG